MCINDMHAQQAKNHLIISNGMIMEGVPEVSSVQEPRGNLEPLYHSGITVFRSGGWSKI